MIKRLAAVLVGVAMLLAGSALAAGNPSPPVGMSWGGPALGVWSPDLSKLNDVLGATLNVKIDVPLTFISGIGDAGIIPGFSVGGFGGGGSVREGNLRFAAGFGGFMFNRTLPLKEGYWFYGGFLGGGGAELVINDDSQPPTTIGEALSTAQQTYLKTGFFVIGPQVGLQIPVTPFIQFRASAGYLLAVGGDWELVGRYELSGGRVNWSGPTAQIGVVFGGSWPTSPPVPMLEEATVNL